MKTGVIFSRHRVTRLTCTSSTTRSSHGSYIHPWAKTTCSSHGSYVHPWAKSRVIWPSISRISPPIARDSASESIRQCNNVLYTVHVHCEIGKCISLHLIINALYTMAQSDHETLSFVASGDIGKDASHHGWYLQCSTCYTASGLREFCMNVEPKPTKPLKKTKTNWLWHHRPTFSTQSTTTVVQDYCWLKLKAAQTTHATQETKATILSWRSVPIVTTTIIIIITTTIIIITTLWRQVSRLSPDLTRTHCYHFPSIGWQLWKC